MRCTLLVALLATVAVSAGAQSSSDDHFNWHGAIPAGAWVRVMNLNGSIDVEAANGSETTVEGEKQWRRGDPKDVRFEVHQDGQNVTICALWDEDDSCDDRGYHSHGHHRDNHDDVSVHFTVHLARDVKVDVNTVNGSVGVSGATSEVDAHTVNGRVEASTGNGPVSASTVNGSVYVRMDKLTGDADLDYSTVNGSVTVEVPSSFSGELDLSTVNGSIRTDFPLTVSGRIEPKHIRASLGDNHRRVKLRTVNGSIELRKLG